MCASLLLFLLRSLLFAWISLVDRFVVDFIVVAVGCRVVTGSKKTRSQQQLLLGQHQTTY